MKHAAFSILALLSGCAASPAASNSLISDLAPSHLVTDGAYITEVLFPDGRSALPPRQRPPGDLEPVIALNAVEVRPGKYTLIAGCSHIKDGPSLSLAVDLAAGRRYVIRCAKDPLRLVVGA